MRIRAHQVHQQQQLTAMQSLSSSSAKLPLAMLLIAAVWLFPADSNGSPVADRFVRRQVDFDGDAITVDADDVSVRYGSPYNPYPNSNGNTNFYNYPGNPPNYPSYGSYGPPNYNYNPPVMNNTGYNYYNNVYYGPGQYYPFTNTTLVTTASPAAVAAAAAAAAAAATTTTTTTTYRPPYGNYYVFNFRDANQTDEGVYADPDDINFNGR